MMVSVVIPAYNQARYITEAIESVLAQTFTDFELIVVDDGSTDDTHTELERYSARTRVIRQTNRGASAALNVGIREAHGAWISMLSADDAWEPTKLERQVHIARSNPDVGLVYTDFAYVDQDGLFLARERYPPQPSSRRGTLFWLVRGCYVNGSTVMVRRDVFDKVGLFDERERWAPDWDMWLRIAMHYRLARVPEALVRYRIHPGQATARRDEMARAAKRVASRTFRRFDPLRGAWAALVRLKKEIREFPSGVRRSVAEKTFRRQFGDLIEWFVILVNPETSWSS